MRRFIQLFGQLLQPTARRFHAALEQPQRAQQRVQQAICDRLVASDYGQSLGIRSIADWQRLPVVTYEDLEPWIERAGLTPEPILFYEKTSGSAGAVKRIPYTRSLRRSFNQMFCVWAQDLIQNGPAFETGQLYACISPNLGLTSSQAGPATLQDDSEYLDRWLRWLLRPFLVMPSGLKQVSHPDEFKYRLALALVQAERLETISVWSPSFLQVQLAYIQAHQQELIQALNLRADRRQLLSQPAIPWTQLWPHLKLISCWDSVHAADQAASLRLQFPAVLVQGKGLLATEAPITIPLIAAGGYVPVLDQVFLEFEDGSGHLHRLEDLRSGDSYNLILSQKGGLYRYRLGDQVRVTHWYRQTPCLEFCGRGQGESDLVGEKLHPDFVRQVLQTLPLGQASFKSLVPIAHPPHYGLLLDRAKSPGAIAVALEQGLSESYHYRRARMLGQLAPPIVLVANQMPELLAMARTSRGRVWGGIKYGLLQGTAIDPELLDQIRQVAIRGTIQQP